MSVCLGRISECPENRSDVGRLGNDTIQVALESERRARFTLDPVSLNVTWHRASDHYSTQFRTRPALPKNRDLPPPMDGSQIRAS